MNTKTVSPARRIVLAALFLALAFLLPMVTGHVPQVGNMLCPMHFPILLCGFVLGGPWGLAVGFAAPLLRSVLFGMPPMFPIAVSMAFELAAYGLVSGVLWHKVKHTVPMMYASLVTAMVAGRLVWGAVRFVLAGLTYNEERAQLMTFSDFRDAWKPGYEKFYGITGVKVVGVSDGEKISSNENVLTDQNGNTTMVPLKNVNGAIDFTYNNGVLTYRNYNQTTATFHVQIPVVVKLEQSEKLPNPSEVTDEGMVIFDSLWQLAKQ